MFDYENFKEAHILHFLDHFYIVSVYQQCFDEGQMHNILYLDLSKYEIF